MSVRPLVIGSVLLGLVVSVESPAAACTVSGKKVALPLLSVRLPGQRDVVLDILSWPLAARFRGRSPRVEILSRGTIQFKAMTSFDRVPLRLARTRATHGGVARLAAGARLRALSYGRRRLRVRVKLGKRVSITLALPCRDLSLTKVKLKTKRPSTAASPGPLFRSKTKFLWLRAGRRRGPRLRVDLDVPAGVPFEVVARVGRQWRVRARFGGGHMLVGWTQAKALLPYVPGPTPAEARRAYGPFCGFGGSHSWRGPVIVAAGTRIRTSPSPQGTVWGHVTRPTQVVAYLWNRARSPWVRIMELDGQIRMPESCRPQGGKAWVPRSAVSFQVTAPSTP